MFEHRSDALTVLYDRPLAAQQQYDLLLNYISTRPTLVLVQKLMSRASPSQQLCLECESGQLLKKIDGPQTASRQTKIQSKDQE